MRCPDFSFFFFQKLKQEENKANNCEIYTLSHTSASRKKLPKSTPSHNPRSELSGLSLEQKSKGLSTCPRLWHLMCPHSFSSVWNCFNWHHMFILKCYCGVLISNKSYRTCKAHDPCPLGVYSPARGRKPSASSNASPAGEAPRTRERRAHVALKISAPAGIYWS